MKTIVIIIGSNSHRTEGEERNSSLTYLKSEAFKLRNLLGPKNKNIIVYDLNSQDIEPMDVESAVSYADVLVVFDDDASSPEVLPLLAPRLRFQSEDELTVLFCHGPNTTKILSQYDKVVRAGDVQELVWRLRETVLGVSAE